MFFSTTKIILIAAAVLPAIVLLIYVYKKDRLDREPPSLLISLVLLGIISTALAIIGEELGEVVLNLIFFGKIQLAPDEVPSVLYNFIFYFFVVGLSEEGFKYLLLKIRTWKSKHFNCQFDGVVYSVFVSLGFALWENVGYVLANGFNIALLRAITAVPGHACFGVFMGTFYSLAKKYDLMGEKKKCKAFKNMALFMPILFHGTYDFIISLDNSLFSIIFVVFVIVMFIISFILVKRLSKNDKYIRQDYTPRENQNVRYYEPQNTRQNGRSGNNYGGGYNRNGNNYGGGYNGSNNYGDGYNKQGNNYSGGGYSQNGNYGGGNYNQRGSNYGRNDRTPSPFDDDFDSDWDY